ncbi:AMP-binding protein [Fluoribacter gormanii]|uniref:AMP-binding protein n=1 Tax=Fluoribacter gormanii TaxID=464 RepID=UPI0010413355|nr:AMP-binding protein [Fluoribacter gormanii]MCW8471342.1 AMP-binding protein [Fluoribacter gormanii]
MESIEINPQVNMYIGDEVYTSEEIQKRVLLLTDIFKQTKVKKLAILMDNHPNWIIVSLAALAADVWLTPIPVFFTAEQIENIMKSLHPDSIVSDSSETLMRLTGESATKISDGLFLARIEPYPQNNDTNFSGILTYTSGSTGAPKGVLLPYANVIKQINALYDHVNPDSPIRYLAITPLSILLENVICLTVIKFGGALFLEPVSRFLNVTNFGIKVEELINYIDVHQIDTLLLMPIFLENMINFLEAKQKEAPSCIKLIAVGSAMINQNLIKRALALKLPVYQGYGLTESSSIVSMNTRHNNNSLSAGKILPHIQVKIGPENNILVKGNLFHSYLNEEPINQNEFYDTGDLGFVEHGFLFITGRKKNIFSLMSGRNISPEWIESKVYKFIPQVKNIAVIGNGRPFVSIIVDLNAPISDKDFQNKIKLVNNELPGFAHIKAYCISTEPFSIENNLLDRKSRPNTARIIEHFKAKIQDISDGAVSG